MRNIISLERVEDIIGFEKFGKSSNTFMSFGVYREIRNGAVVGYVKGIKATFLFLSIGVL